MIRLYRFVTNLIYLLVYPFGRYKARRGDQLWTDRLALATYNTPVDIWLHAASVGEVRVVNCLVTYLFEENPHLKIHLTVMTRTGYQTARSLFGPEVDVSYLPLDVPRLIRRKLQAVRPRLLIIAETEIWPNLILETSKVATPIILVNGRMSDRAMRQYRLVADSIRSLLDRYDRIFVKSEADHHRFVNIMGESDKIIIAGDMKFDAPLHSRSEERRRSIRDNLGIAAGARVLVAGSTREGEEQPLLDIYCRLRESISDLRMIIAPRHIDRSGQVEDLARTAGLTVKRLSAGETKNGSDSVILIDRMGMLNDLYLASDLAFVGGTLVDIGGHNLLEPVWAGTPVLFGPSVKNVADAAAYIKEHNYGAMTESVSALETVARDFLQGRIQFAVKTEAESASSATSLCGAYLLEKLKGA